MVIVKRDGLLNTPGAAAIWLFTGKRPPKAKRVTRAQASAVDYRSKSAPPRNAEDRAVALQWRLH